MAGNTRIWRDSNTVPITDIVEFNDNAALPDATGGVMQTQITLTSAIAINEKPKGKLDELQDTGFATLSFQITGTVENPTNSAIPALIKQWMIDDKTTDTYPFGRFGIELDDFPDYDIHPNSNRGAILADWSWVREGQTRGKAAFVATVRFNANLTGLNSPTYAWDGV